MGWLFGWAATTAVTQAFKSAAKGLTRKTYKNALRSTLERLCEAYTWDDENEESDTVILVKDIKICAKILDEFLRSVGMRVGEGSCTVGLVRIKLSLGLDIDMGLFSKPWQVEVHDIQLHLELGVGVSAAEEAVDLSSDGGAAEKPTPSMAEEWLPLHRAAENLQLTVRNTMITIQGLEPGARMVCRLEALDFFPTDAEWTPIADVRTVEEGSVLHKVLCFDQLEVYTDAVTPADMTPPLELDQSTLMPSADEDSSPVFLPGPAIPRRLVLVSGVKGKCKIRKKLSKDLTGAVASDFFGDAYLFQLSLLSDGAPRLRMPLVALHLAWNEAIESYVLNMEKPLQFSVGHELDAPTLAEIVSWQRQFLQAYAHVAPSAEAQLALERVWRMDEHNKLGDMHRKFVKAVRVAREAKAEVERLNAAAAQEQAARCAADAAVEEQRVRASELLSRLEAQRAAVHGPPGEDAREAMIAGYEAAVQALQAIAGPDRGATGGETRKPFEDGYQLGDVSRRAASSAQAGVEAVVRNASGNAEYKFGDLTRGALRWMSS